VNYFLAVLPALAAVAYAISGALWWRGSQVTKPIIEPTFAGIVSFLTLSQNVSSSVRWNRRAAVAAAVGAGLHILGMIPY
jgi:hypothetical protein